MEKPTRPLSRMVRDGGGYDTCPICGSSRIKTCLFGLIGELKCLQPKCSSNNKK